MASAICEDTPMQATSEKTETNPNAQTRPMNLAAIQKVVAERREEIARFSFRCGYQAFLAKK